jgi:predicted secreted protein
MAKVNGTSVLVYCDDTLIAAQKGCTVNIEQALPDCTSKDSAGWEEHINGTRVITCDFDALFSTTGLSDEDLIAQLTDRDTIELSISGGGIAIIGDASLQNVSINAPQEEAAGISGTFKFNITDGAYILAGASTNLITDPDGGGHTYDTCTVSDLTFVTCYKEAAEIAYVYTNDFSVTEGDIINVLIVDPVANTDEVTLSILDTGVGELSTNQNMSVGVDFAWHQFIISTTSTNARLAFVTATSVTWSTGTIYLFKV